ncbi:MAG: hypothetical protein ACI4BA_06995 [Prevotella sp.]
MLRQKHIIYIARALSLLFTPFYLPVIGLSVLFTFSYLSLLPWLYKIEVVLLVYFFTVLLPTFLIYLYRKCQRWSLIELGRRERRAVPYLISIVCYFSCIYLMQQLCIPRFMGSIVVAALIVQIVCAIINNWWKISTHTAAIGGVGGALLAFADIFGYNPIGWLCVVILVAGLLGSSRMILRQHSLLQVLAGFGVGLVCAWGTILL